MAGGTSTVAYAHPDALASVQRTTDSSATAVGSTPYDAFGAVRRRTGTSLSLGYSGQQRDAESGLSSLRARFYDPTTARFLSKDPVRGGHGYAYANNNPVRFTDPTGMLVEPGDGAFPGTAHDEARGDRVWIAYSTLIGRPLLPGFLVGGPLGAIQLLTAEVGFVHLALFTQAEGSGMLTIHEGVNRGGILTADSRIFGSAPGDPEYYATMSFIGTIPGAEQKLIAVTDAIKAMNMNEATRIHYGVGNQNSNSVAYALLEAIGASKDLGRYFPDVTVIYGEVSFSSHLTRSIIVVVGFEPSIRIPHQVREDMP
jgi:RHS repeat-associated protein